MTELRTVEQPCNIKINDSGTKIQFYASDDNGRISFTENDTLIFKIKNSMGYVTETQGSSASGGYIAELNSADLSVLTPDTYFIELWVTKNGNTVIYPDKAFCPIAVTQNVMSIAGDVLPTTSLSDFENSLKAYVEQQASTATTNIKNDFQSYVDSITDSTIKTAEKASSDAQSAISTANVAVDTANTAKSTAESAVSTANTAKSTADTATTKANNAQSTADSATAKADNAQNTANTANQKAQANASLITANNTLIQTNTNSINGGLYLDMAKSLTQANTSKNLIINSSMQTKQDGIHPYSDWQCIWGWTYSNGNLAIRKNWYGHEAIQANQITNSVALLSQGVYAGTVRSSTVYSAKVHYMKYGALTDTTYTFYLEYAYQNDFQNSQKIEIGNVNKDSNDDNWIIKENMTVPEGYNWLRLRVEASTEKPETYLFIGSPMLNYGSTVLDYIPSNQSGQRISVVESQLASIQQAQSIMLTQMATIQSSINSEGSGS